MRTLVPGALLVCAATSCLGTDARAATSQGLELAALDWRGEETPLDELTRRPRLVLATPSGIDPETEAVTLISGAPDTALLEDLGGAPLREEHAARVVPCEVVTRGGALELVPLAALDRDAPYTLAVGAWARSPSGAHLPIDDDALPHAFELRTSADSTAGAAALGAWPADGASGVGVDLQEAVVYFDGEATDAERGVWIEGPDGLAVPASVRADRCDVALGGRRASHCVSLVPTGALVPAAAHAIRVGTAARDAHGAPIGPWRASFGTDTVLDRVPPVAMPHACDVDERPFAWGCALVDDARIALRVRASEPVRMQISAEGGVQEVLAPGGDGEATLAGLAPGRAVAVEIVLFDAAGNAARWEETIETEPPLPTLSIVEVRADPLGPEPAQEFVELHNYGDTAVALLGFSLADHADAHGTPIESASFVHPDARVLLVPDAFDRDDPRDAQPPPGALLVRVGAALADSGLTNTGERLYLRDPWGRRVSAAPATPDPRPGVCNVRVTDDMRDGRDGSFARDPGDGCTPGR